MGLTGLAATLSFGLSQRSDDEQYFYRGMLPAADGGPEIGPSKKKLGAVIGSGPSDDIPVNADGNVTPGLKGISVNLMWDQIPAHRLPMTFPGGRGKGLVMYRMRANLVPSGLAAVADGGGPGHLVLAPSVTMSGQAYQGLLASALGLWEEVGAL